MPRRLPLSEHDEIAPYGDLEGSPPTRAVKRAVRRALRRHLWPLTAQMSRHNRAVSTVLAAHRHQLTWLAQECERLRCDTDLLGPPGE